MLFKRTLAMSMAVLATLTATTAAFADHRDVAREQLHRVDLGTRDLIPAFAEQMRDPGPRGSSSYGYGLGSDQLQTLMIIGKFRGQAEAFHEVWDRYPDASLYGPLRDLDTSFRATDLNVRRSRSNADVSSRWERIRQAYFQFRRDVDLDGRAYNGSRSWNDSSGTYDNNGTYNNNGNGSENGYYDNNGNFHRNNGSNNRDGYYDSNGVFHRNNGVNNRDGYYDSNGIFHRNNGVDNNTNDDTNNGYYDDNGVFHRNPDNNITTDPNDGTDVQPHIEINPGR